jgi:hypothetical protein
MRNVLATARLSGLLFVLGTATVSAHSATFNFKRTLASAVNGNNAVTGQFYNRHDIDAGERSSKCHESGAVV